jgi:hypothetical protein
LFLTCGKLKTMSATKETGSKIPAGGHGQRSHFDRLFVTVSCSLFVINEIDTIARKEIPSAEIIDRQTLLRSTRSRFRLFCNSKRFIRIGKQ